MYIEIVVVDRGDRLEYYADHPGRGLTIYLGPDERRAAIRMYELFWIMPRSSDLVNGATVPVPDAVGEHVFSSYGVRPVPSAPPKLV